jgi:hypothetical protein
MLLQRAEMSRRLPSGSLGTFAQRESELWLKSPENLPTTKRARREKITVTTINARMTWTCRRVLGAMRAADLGPSPAGEKPRLRVRVQGEPGLSVLTQSPDLSVRDENNCHASHRERKHSLRTGNSQRYGAHNPQRLQWCPRHETRPRESVAVGAIIKKEESEG